MDTTRFGGMGKFSSPFKYSPWNNILSDTDYKGIMKIRLKIFKFIVMLLGYKLVGSRLSPKKGREYLVLVPLETNIYE